MRQWSNDGHLRADLVTILFTLCVRRVLSTCKASNSQPSKHLNNQTIKQKHNRIKWALQEGARRTAASRLDLSQLLVNSSSMGPPPSCVPNNSPQCVILRSCAEHYVGYTSSLAHQQIDGGHTVMRARALTFFAHFATAVWRLRLTPRVPGGRRETHNRAYR